MQVYDSKRAKATRHLLAAPVGLQPLVHQYDDIPEQALDLGQNLGFTRKQCSGLFTGRDAQVCTASGLVVLSGPVQRALTLIGSGKPMTRY